VNLIGRARIQRIEAVVLPAGWTIAVKQEMHLAQRDWQQFLRVGAAPLAASRPRAPSIRQHQSCAPAQGFSLSELDDGGRDFDLAESLGLPWTPGASVLTPTLPFCAISSAPRAAAVVLLQTPSHSIRLSFLLRAENLLQHESFRSHFQPSKRVLDPGIHSRVHTLTVWEAACGRRWLRSGTLAQ